MHRVSAVTTARGFAARARSCRSYPARSRSITRGRSRRDAGMRRDLPRVMLRERAGYERHERARAAKPLAVVTALTRCIQHHDGEGIVAAMAQSFRRLRNLL